MIFPTKALDIGFNAAVLHIADRLMPRGFTVRASLPEFQPGDLPLLRQLIADNDGRMVVWGGGSDHTIFGDPEVNYAFRAWHDWHHLHGNHDFTYPGEVAAANDQAADLIRLYGAAKSSPWRALLAAEVIGQAAYFDRTGTFPDDQVAADLHWLAANAAKQGNKYLQRVYL